MSKVKYSQDEGLVNQITKKHGENEPEPFSLKFQLLASGLIVSSALSGAFLGIIFSVNEVSPDLISWVALPGDLFIRALTCVVLPLVFVNIIIAVMQMIEAGKAGKVGKYTVLLYVLTTFIAAMEGLISVFIFQSFFEAENDPPALEFVRILCPVGNTVLVQDVNDLRCVPNTDIAANSSLSRFDINDINDFFVTAGADFDTISFSETLQNGIFRQLVSDNIVDEFASGGFVGIVMFGIIFGAASASLVNQPRILLNFMEEINEVFIQIIQWIILVTPFAVFSLIVGALASQEDLEQTFANVGYLLAAAITGVISHLFIVHPLLFYYFTRENPFEYMKYLFPAQIFAFSCASSAATLPVTMRCIKQTGKVPDSVRDFILPIGATVNMDGGALYFPAALIFLSRTLGLSSGFAEYFLIVVVSTIGSSGAAPVPNANLVLIITAFNTVYGGSGAPSNFGIIVGIDWLMDRFQTPLNVTGDCMVCRIVTVLAGAEVGEDGDSRQLK